jgi:hypothetical protein
MSRARKNKPQATINIPKESYPILLEIEDKGHSIQRFFFGLGVDKSKSETKKYDLGNGKERTVYEHWRYRHYFNLFKYLKSYSFDAYIYDKPVKEKKESV